MFLGTSTVSVSTALLEVGVSYYRLAQPLAIRKSPRNIKALDLHQRLTEVFKKSSVGRIFGVYDSAA